MPVIAPPTLTPAPTSPDRSDPSTFAARAVALDDWTKNIQIPEAQATLANVYANATNAAASATAAAGAAISGGAIAWVSGKTYSIGDNSWSPVDFQTYKRKTAGAGTTDPSADTTNWARVNLTPQAGDAQETTTASSITLTAASGRLQAVNMTATLMSVVLPVATTLQLGGPLYVIKNTGSYTFSVRDASSNLLTAIAPGQCAVFYLSNNSASAGTWAVGDHSVVAALYPGVVTTINAVGTITSTTVVALSATQAIVMYQVSALKARTLNIVGTAITMGAELAVDASAATLCYGLCALSATQAIASYVVGSVLKTCTLNVSGTSLSAGAVLTPGTTASVTGVTVTALTSTTAVMAYQEGTNTQIHCMTLTVSGTTLTNGAESTGVASGSGAFPNIVTLSATLALVIWNVSGLFKAATVSISGTSATINAVLTVTTLSNGGASVAALSATQAVVMYGYNSPFAVTAALLDISGTNVSVTSSTQIAGDMTNYTTSSSPVARVSATQCVAMLWPSVAGNSVQACLLTIVNGALLESSRKQFAGPVTTSLAINSPQLSPLSATQFVAVYGGVSGYPVANTLELAL